jgi:hypothetical protein
MSADLKALAEQVKVVAGIRERLAKAKLDHSTVRGLCGQRGYDITIAGVRVAVADMDPHTYYAKMIRGREMIHLGALKALDSMVDAYAAHLAHEESKLSTMAGAKP